jgi:hypothetical protein
MVRRERHRRRRVRIRCDRVIWRGYQRHIFDGFRASCFRFKCRRCAANRRPCALAGGFRTLTSGSIPRSRRATSRPAANWIGPGKHALALDPVVAKRASMRSGKDFGFCNREGTRTAERALNVSAANYQPLVHRENIQNTRQPQQVVFARFHEGPPL